MAIVRIYQYFHLRPEKGGQSNPTIKKTIIRAFTPARPQQKIHK